MKPAPLLLLLLCGCGITPAVRPVAKVPAALMPPAPKPMRRFAEAFTAPVAPSAPARTNITLVWLDFTNQPPVSYNLYGSRDCKTWVLLTNVADLSVTLPVDAASRFYGICAVKDGRESARYWEAKQ